MPKADIKTLQNRIGYKFTDPNLLHKALAHPIVDSDSNNEILEFLGDRVLGLVIAEFLAQSGVSKEGEAARRLAYLASGTVCARIAEGWQLEASVPATSEQFTERVLANYCEAIIGAIYQDGGLDVARKFILQQWGARIHETPPIDAKTALQEWAAKCGKGLPRYEKVSSEGPAHQPVFVYQVELDESLCARAEGHSRRQAEQAAALKLLTQLGVIS